MYHKIIDYQHHKFYPGTLAAGTTVPLFINLDRDPRDWPWDDKGDPVTEEDITLELRPLLGAPGDAFGGIIDIISRIEVASAIFGSLII